MRIKDESVTFTENFVAGGVGGILVVLFGHPFDTVKVRLQSMPLGRTGYVPAYNGMMDCFWKTYAREGFKGFFKGMGAPLAGSIPLNAFYFGSYAVACELQQTHPDEELTLFQIFKAGAFSGGATALMTGPIDRLKCVLQVQVDDGKPRFNGPWDVAKKLYADGGLKSIFRGTSATLVRDIPAYGSKIVVYEFLKKEFTPPAERDKFHFGATLMAGGLAGIAYWIVCIPPDVLKSRLQSAPEGEFPNGARDVFKEIWRSEGLYGLFRGTGVLMARAFPANAACFLGLEATMHAFQLWVGHTSLH